MKYLVSALIGVVFISLSVAMGFAVGHNVYVNIPARVLLEEPTAEAQVAYDIPVGVTLLGFTPDKNWYKIKVEYDFVFLGHYEYTGWCYIPIGKLLEEKSTD